MTSLADIAAALPSYDSRAATAWVDSIDEGSFATLGREASPIFDDIDLAVLYRPKATGASGAIDDGVVTMDLLSLAVHSALRAPPAPGPGGLSAYVTWAYAHSRCALLCSLDERRLRELDVRVDASGVPLNLKLALTTTSEALRGWLTRSSVDHASRLTHLAANHDLVRSLQRAADSAPLPNRPVLSEAEAVCRGTHLFFLHVVLGASTGLSGALPDGAHPVVRSALAATVKAHVFPAPEPTSPGTYALALGDFRR